MTIIRINVNGKKTFKVATYKKAQILVDCLIASLPATAVYDISFCDKYDKKQVTNISNK